MAIPVAIPDIPSLKSYVGKPLGTSDWFTVSQEQIQHFASATGDHQWIHVDVERSQKDSPFGGTIAHGYLTMSLIPTLLPQIVRVGNSSRTINYGIDKLRLPVPVPAGSRVRLSAEIKHVRKVMGGAARVTFAVKLHLENTVRPCCTADVVYVYFP